VKGLAYGILLLMTVIVFYLSYRVGHIQGHEAGRKYEAKICWERKK
jgi:hypothetical protein